MKYAQIAGTGRYLPHHIISNQELESRLETTSEWIVEHTGIRQRHIASGSETTAFMATQAALGAMKAAQVKSVDMIIVATTTPDTCFPSTACLIQAELKLIGCPAFDVSAACAGFNYALSIADQFIKTEQCRHVLVIGSETMSRLVDWNDRETCILFGDGAGAVLLTAHDMPGLLRSELYAEGQHHPLLYVDNTHSTIRMKGAAVFRHAVAKLEAAVKTLLASQYLTIESLDWFIPHQANQRMIEMLANKLNLPQEKVVSTVDQHANTSSASIPIALDTAIEEKRIQRGQLLLLESFGGGFTWGSTLIQY